MIGWSSLYIRSGNEWGYMVYIQAIFHSSSVYTSCSIPPTRSVRWVSRKRLRNFKLIFLIFCFLIKIFSADIIKLENITRTIH